MKGSWARLESVQKGQCRTLPSGLRCVKVLSKCRITGQGYAHDMSEMLRRFQACEAGWLHYSPVSWQCVVGPRLRRWWRWRGGLRGSRCPAAAHLNSVTYGSVPIRRSGYFDFPSGCRHRACRTGISAIPIVKPWTTSSNVNASINGSFSN